MAKVIWDRQANDDLDSIISYIDRFDPGAADRIGSRLYDLGESLADFPRRGRPAPDGMREMPSVRPYVLSYTVEKELVTIRRVRHGRQRR